MHSLNPVEVAVLNKAHSDELITDLAEKPLDISCMQHLSQNVRQLSMPVPAFTSPAPVPEPSTPGQKTAPTPLRLAHITATSPSGFSTKDTTGGVLGFWRGNRKLGSGSSMEWLGRGPAMAFHRKRFGFETTQAKPVAWSNPPVDKPVG